MRPSKLRSKSRYFALTAGMLISATCAADWQLLDGSTGHFVDPATFRSSGRSASVWAMETLQPAVEFPTGSAKSKQVYIEADCQQYQVRTLAYSFRADPQGTGKELDSANPGYGTKSARWRFVSPDSLDQEVFNKLCLKPKPATKPEPIVADPVIDPAQGTPPKPDTSI